MNTKLIFRPLAAMLLLGAGTAVLAQPTPDSNKTPPAEKPVSDMDKIGNAAESVVEKPLRDLNLMKDKIPPELQAILAKPYSLAGLKTCSQYSTAINKLTNVLGPDVDSGMAEKKGENPGEFALSIGQSVAGSLIPGSGIIRKISGADTAQKKAAAAVLAGQLRRAYLKGTARAKHCKV